MSTIYQAMKDVPTDALITRLNELSDAVTKGPEARNREFTMRVPAECDRDADLVLCAAAGRLDELRAALAESERQLREVRAERIPDWNEVPPIGQWTDEGQAAFDKWRNEFRARHDWEVPDRMSYMVGYSAASHVRHRETLAWKQAHEDLLAVKAQDNAALSATIDQQRARIEELEAEVEKQRMQLVACSVLAMCNTEESLTRNREMHPDYYCLAVEEVIKAVEREMRERDRALAAEKDAENMRTHVGLIATAIERRANKLPDHEPDTLVLIGFAANLRAAIAARDGEEGVR